MNQQRLARVLRNMERDGLEQIVVTSTASVYYLTGYWVEPMERMLALYLRADGTCTLPGRLGVDKAWPSKFLIALLNARPDVTPVLGSAPVDDARKYKDADEIAAMRHASRINDQVVEQVIAAVKEGAVESELAAYVESLYRQHGADRSSDVKEGAVERELAAYVDSLYRQHGADRSSEGQLVCFGPNGADPHHGPNDTVLKDGDSVVLDIFIPIRRYWCDMTRTVFFRSVSDGRGPEGL